MRVSDFYPRQVCLYILIAQAFIEDQKVIEKDIMKNEKGKSQNNRKKRETKVRKSRDSH